MGVSQKSLKRLILHECERSELQSKKWTSVSSKKSEIWSIAPKGNRRKSWKIVKWILKRHLTKTLKSLFKNEIKVKRSVTLFEALPPQSVIQADALGNGVPRDHPIKRVKADPWQEKQLFIFGWRSKDSHERQLEEILCKRSECYSDWPQKWPLLGGPASQRQLSHLKAVL